MTQDTRHKTQDRRIAGLLLIIVLSWVVGRGSWVCFAQQSDDLEFTLDVNSAAVPLPKIFRPNIDLSGRGYSREPSWPQALAARETLDTWGKDIGFNGLFRLQYNLWEINQLAKDKEAQNKLLSNYDTIFKEVTDAGGIVILNIFGTPAGLGRVLDKKSAPWDLRAFKELVKALMRDLNCQKRYNIWYEVWNAPDLEDFFLGRKQEYLNLYRVVAESAQELEEETKAHILVGGPSTSWWFQNFADNTILTPEHSLIYELIKFCYRNRLPLDFISWHGFSSDPAVEKENTIYKKSALGLIRNWLSYFNFGRDIPLIVDEWNFDLNANVLAERKEKSNVAASYLLSRIKNMSEAGLTLQVYFCLEDFDNNRDGLTRNVGIFDQGQPKAAYNAFRMLHNLGNEMFSPKSGDEFSGVIATKSPGAVQLLIFNYSDPRIAVDYLAKNFSRLSGKERKVLLRLINSEKLDDILARRLSISGLRATRRAKALLKNALELEERAGRFKSRNRNLKLTLKNLKAGAYLYSRYSLDASCGAGCAFAPAEEKDVAVAAGGLYQEALSLNPYSAQLLILREKPPEAVKSAEPKQ
ncbi:MAG: hypothetical protein Q8N85_00890 [Candidatus Omnitrophota bacterium]|nr:hypothetical protein [Candidatus Omnitrophota bacterium]